MCRLLVLSALPEALLPLLTLSEDVAGSDVIRSLRRISPLEAASSDTALPVEESLWTLTLQRQWPLSFRAFTRSSDKSLRDFLKGRHGVFCLRYEQPPGKTAAIAERAALSTDFPLRAERYPFYANHYSLLLLLV